METVAFYSYKGGVGRSLLLANAARFLAALGKGVVALDLDFEAPGLHYKFGTVPPPDTASAFLGGAVPYLNAMAEGAIPPPPLAAHMLDLPVPMNPDGWLRLMPAGPAPQQGYWAAFNELGVKLRLGDPSGKGFMAFLDLQARITDELKPDYLLIDSRAGVTELGSLATTVLADTVVCMFVANQESLDGTLTVAEALRSAPRLAKQKPIRIVPVLSRSTAKQPDEERFAGGIQRLLNLGQGKTQGKETPATLVALPHDDTLGSPERGIGGDQKTSVSSLYMAYLETLVPEGPGEAGAAGVCPRAYRWRAALAGRSDHPRPAQKSHHRSGRRPAARESGIESRLEASIETAAKLANGLVLVAVVNGEERLYSHKMACPAAHLRHGQPGDLGLEDRIPEDVRNALAKKGHKISLSGPWVLGRNAAIQIDPGTGVLSAGADPRDECYDLAW